MATPPRHHAALPQPTRRATRKRTASREGRVARGREGKARAVALFDRSRRLRRKLQAFRRRNLEFCRAEACAFSTVSLVRFCRERGIQRETYAVTWPAMVVLWSCTRRLSRTTCWTGSLISWNRYGLRPPQGRCVSCRRVLSQTNTSLPIKVPCPKFTSQLLGIIRTLREEPPLFSVNRICGVRGLRNNHGE